MLMQEDGVEFRIDGDEILIRQLGEGRRADGTETTRVFQLQGQPAREYAGPACTVAISSGLDPAQDAAAERLVDQATAELAEQAGIGADEAYRSVVRRDAEPLETADQALVDAWVETSFGVFADGQACEGTLADRAN